jgi:hypothetical protein
MRMALASGIGRLCSNHILIHRLRVYQKSKSRAANLAFAFVAQWTAISPALLSRHLPYDSNKLSRLAIVRLVKSRV